MRVVAKPVRRVAPHLDRTQELELRHGLVDLGNTDARDVLPQAGFVARRVVALSALRREEARSVGDCHPGHGPVVDAKARHGGPAHVPDPIDLAGQIADGPLEEGAAGHHDLEVSGVRRHPTAPLAVSQVGGHGDRMGAILDRAPGKVGEKAVDGLAAAREQRVEVVPLRHALARFSAVGEHVPVYDRDLGEVSGQGNGGERAGDASSDDDGSTRAFAWRGLL